VPAVLSYPPMSSIVVRGGTRLSGSVAISGSKNAALPIMCAALLNEQPVRLRNIPALKDVRLTGDVLHSLGAEYALEGEYASALVNAGTITSTAPPYELVNQMRASFLVMGPLLARYGEADVPLPGGCEIGARPVDEHLAAFRQLGAEITQQAGLIKARARKLVGTEIYLNKPSVGATENVVMAASLAEGTTVLHNAALEPEVVDLCNFLARCGVGIGGIGTKSITIHGQPRLSAAVDYTIIPDRIEAGTYLLALVGTRGEGTVHNARPDHLEALVLKLRECGVAVDHGDDWIEVQSPQELRAVTIKTDVYPGFPTDLQAQMSAVMTTASGIGAVHETIFESRMKHIPELIRLGAKVQISGDSAIIEGHQHGLNGAPVEAHDLRCAAALVVAGLMASGETRISGLSYLLRGYERMPEKVAGIGGHVEYEYNPEPVASQVDEP
jgi:UDP-N-acetylglucosamine 1-carboxyvinyltransferase